MKRCPVLVYSKTMDVNAKLLQELLGPTEEGIQFEEEIPGDLSLCGPVEIKVKSNWVPTTSEIFRSWTGHRRIWGMEYHGPVYVLGKDEKTYSGARLCPCAVCQESVSPEFRMN